MKYLIHTTQENELPMIEVIKEMKLWAVLWPNQTNPQFKIDVTEEELLILKLKVPVAHCVRA